jgi:CHAT domain-containing protein
VYNEINPEGLLSPAGKFVIDDVRLTLISTTRDILGEKKMKVRPAGQQNLALILGDPEYYAPDFKGDKQIEQLPGTRAEIEKVSSVLKANRWEVVTLTDTGASERRIKSVGNPRILHIATHGFFKENARAGSSESSFSLLNRNRAIDNPLLRSGLYLKSAGNTLEQSEGKNQFHLGEGVMSALEAMNLNLSGSELVVLSACETGRGDLQAGEGVYGLQRSFQIAGAKAIIMSLFKVSDEATQELMDIFYKNWIERGMTIRESFYQAKLELKKTRPEPLLWSSFVLVGG